MRIKLITHVNILARSTCLISNLSLLSILTELVPHLCCFSYRSLCQYVLSTRVTIENRGCILLIFESLQFSLGKKGDWTSSDFQTPSAFYETLVTIKNICNMEHSCDFCVCTINVEWLMDNISLKNLLQDTVFKWVTDKDLSNTT